MKNRIFLALALALVIATPLIAQTEDATPQTEAETVETAATAETADNAATQQVEGDAQSAEIEESAEMGEELPQTASPLALLALLGLGASGAAVGVRKLRRGR